MQNQDSYYVLKIRTKVYNPREMEEMRDTFEVRDLRFETEQDALDYIRTREVKLSNVISLEHRVVNNIKIHEKLKRGAFIVGVDGRTHTFNTKEEALDFIQSQTSDRISLTCMPYKE